MIEQDIVWSEHNSTYRLAGFWVRLWAYLCDLIIISILNFWLIRPLVQLIKIPDLISTWLQINMVSLGLIGFLYFTIMTALWSQTIGKMIMGIKVIRCNGQQLDLLTVVFREVVGRTISQLLGLHLGYFWLIFNRRKQAWHDRFGDTYVVYEKDLTLKQFVHIPTNQLD